MDKTNPVSVAGYPERRLEVKETEVSIHDITQSIFVSSEGGYIGILKRTSLTKVLLRRFEAKEALAFERSAVNRQVDVSYHSQAACRVACRA